MLDVLLTRKMTVEDKSRILEEEFNIAMSEDIGSEVWDMCNLSIGVYEEGYNDAYDDAYNDAYDESAINAIKNLMNKKGWDMEECMEVLDIPDDKRESYRETILSELATI